MGPARAGSSSSPLFRGRTAAVLPHLTPIGSIQNRLRWHGLRVRSCSSDEGEDLLVVVVAETGQGNLRCHTPSLVYRTTFIFGGFHAQLFVGVGGSRKARMMRRLGSVVASTQLYWPYGGKHDVDGARLGSSTVCFQSHPSLTALASKVCRDKPMATNEFVYPGGGRSGHVGPWIGSSSSQPLWLRQSFP